MKAKFFVLLVLWVLVTVPAAAQDGGDLPEPFRVELEAADGLVLVGDFYAAQVGEDETAPAIILMHMYDRTRADWEPILPALLNDLGFNVLNIDLRGHGETGGNKDWDLAAEDLTLWIEWLRPQKGVDSEAVSLMGASIGANMAIVGRAQNPEIVAAVALSPGLEYSGVQTDTEDLLKPKRPLLLMAAQYDSYSVETIKALFMQSRGIVTAHHFFGTEHGTNLFKTRLEETEAALIPWLRAYATAPRDLSSPF